MANELALTKETTARYVHNAAEMESAVFTIDRAIMVCKEQKEQAEKKSVIRETKEEQDLRRRRHELWNLRWERAHFNSDNPLSEKMGRSMGFGALIGFIVGFVLVAVVLSVLESSEKTNMVPAGVLAPSIVMLTPLVGVISGVIIRIIINKNHRTYKLYSLDQRITEVERSISRYEDEADSAKKLEQDRIKNAHQRADFLNSQLTDLCAKRNQIKSTLSRFYDLGVIPPDYRHMDCAIMLDQIFRNDLADTMREAVTLYEERVFRGEVIRGMDKICSMLNNLTAGMAIIGERISSIDSNVKMMSQDLYNFSERIAMGQAEQKKATEQLIRETEMSRYATEQVAESNKNLEWFERRRQGWV